MTPDDTEMDSDHQPYHVEPSVEELEAMMLSQEEDLHNLVALHEQASHSQHTTALATAAVMQVSNSPRSQHWGSDDEDFEEALLQSLQDDGMDMS